ncbi:hypothetical protein C8J56DRAFT_1163618 [Mycena floridula]|nr:hypothetical protein C8J56DRAFT_1163618 [Mycena floridula]
MRVPQLVMATIMVSIVSAADILKVCTGSDLTGHCVSTTTALFDLTGICHNFTTADISSAETSDVARCTLFTAPNCAGQQTFMEHSTTVNFGAPFENALSSYSCLDV